MARPAVPQGVLNRLKASVIFPAVPALNVTPSFLLPEGIDLAFEGQSTAALPAMTGIVTSPEPYQLTRITIHLNKAQAFANLWKSRMELNTVLGDGVTIRLDTQVVDPYVVDNCSITGVDRLNLGGRDAGWVVAIVGAYSLNSALWD